MRIGLCAGSFVYIVQSVNTKTFVLFFRTRYESTKPVNTVSEIQKGCYLFEHEINVHEGCCRCCGGVCIRYVLLDTLKCETNVHFVFHIQCNVVQDTMLTPMELTNLFVENHIIF